MRLLAAVIGLGLFAAPPLAAQITPRPIDLDPRIQSVDYVEDKIIQLSVAPGYQLTVEFGPDEMIESVAVGDASSWQATPSHRGDHMFIKPVAFGVTTNMTVVTSIRTYLFELIPLGGPSPNMAYTLRFNYPSVDGGERADEQVVSVEGRYKLSGSSVVRPIGISDDGIHTYIEWHHDDPVPAVYAIDRSGRESLVNGMMRDDIFVIDRVSPKLMFRIDNHVAHARRVVEAN
ncbi:TrbG/VirB9 family P-type conjugative transfer protein [Sphingopyxis sp.]|uniref:TrbG/VirB9 family P-type conjugative transfer protein n=1 Tax=Sphingopyxis sp. TaxID=1908224 RepID=UPI0035B2789E